MVGEKGSTGRTGKKGLQVTFANFHSLWILLIST